MQALQHDAMPGGRGQCERHGKAHAAASGGGGEAGPASRQGRIHSRLAPRHAISHLQRPGAAERTARLPMRAATVSLACRRALAPSASRWAQAGAAPRTRLHRGWATAAPPPPPCGAAAAAAAQQQPGGGGAAPTPKQQHVALQADYFDREVKALQESITPEVDAQLARIAAAIPGLSPASRVLDAGAGEGALIPHLQASGGGSLRVACMRAAHALAPHAGRGLGCRRLPPRPGTVPLSCAPNNQRPRPPFLSLPMGRRVG